MKIAVINFSGNVGKSTIARHLLAPRICGAKLLSIESLNADADQTQVMRGDQFSELQEYLQVFANAIVDIGASNVEELLALMHRYRGRHADFDYFVVPTVPARKQQQDTLATLAELARLGVRAERIRVVFNQVEADDDLERCFAPVLDFLRTSGAAAVSVDCRLEPNEIYGRIRGSGQDIASIASDTTDFKSLISDAPDVESRIEVARRLATHRLALGILPELDACFAALALTDSLQSVAETAAL